MDHFITIIEGQVGLEHILVTCDVNEKNKENLCQDITVKEDCFENEWQRDYFNLRSKTI